MRVSVFSALIVLVVCSFAPAQTYRTLEDLKNLEGFVQKLPKGSIAPISQPEYVPAAQAQIPDTAWVIGVELNGEAKAYSLNLLNSHTVVNETFASRPVAIVWGPFSNIATVYEREVDGQTLDFAVSGAIYNNAVVLFDSQTDSYWPIATGEAIGGPKQGTVLKRAPAVRKVPFGIWKKEYPHTTVLAVEGVSHTEDNPYLQILSSPNPLIPVERPNKLLPPKNPVYAFDLDGKAYAIAHNSAELGWQGKAGSSQVFLFRPPKASPFLSTVAYNLGSDKLKKKSEGWVSKTNGLFNPWTGVFDSGAKAQLISGIDTFWVVWSESHKKVKILNPPRREHRKFETVEGAPVNGDDPSLFRNKN